MIVPFQNGKQPLTMMGHGRSADQQTTDEGMGNDQEPSDPLLNVGVDDEDLFVLTEEQEDAVIYARTFGTMEMDLYYLHL